MMSEARPPICDYEGSNYQESFWDRGQRAYEDRVEAIALRRLLPSSGELLLEVGAGAGRNTPRYRGYQHIVLLDYSYTQLQQARERLRGAGDYVYVAADAYRLPFVPGLFDAATMIRTLHHMAEAPKALEQVRQVLRPAGVFILEFANKRNLKAILRFLMGRQTWDPFSHEPVEFAELNFDFHPARVRQWLRESRFEIERQLTVSHFRMELLKRVIPLELLVWLDSVAQWTGEWWQYTPSVFLRARAVGDTPSAAQDGFFKCPACGYHPLDVGAEALVCSSCKRRWEIREGIYDFRDR